MERSTDGPPAKTEYERDRNQSGAKFARQWDWKQTNNRDKALGDRLIMSKKHTESKTDGIWMLSDDTRLEGREYKWAGEWCHMDNKVTGEKTTLGKYVKRRMPNQTLGKQS